MRIASAVTLPRELLFLSVLRHNYESNARVGMNPNRTTWMNPENMLEVRHKGQHIIRFHLFKNVQNRQIHKDKKLWPRLEGE